MIFYSPKALVESKILVWTNFHDELAVDFDSRFPDDDDERMEDERRTDSEEGSSRLPCVGYGVSLKRMAQRDIPTLSG